VPARPRRTVDDLLAAARARVSPRPGPDEALAATRAGALVVDLRSEDERRRDGIIPGSLHVPRSVLEWRADPDSPWRNPLLADLERPLILVCAHGFSSSLAAANLREIGFAHATDLAGGFEAWREAGLPVVDPPEPADALPGMGTPDG
jgi:rhodanese-related sulfurtransferase